MPCDSAEKCNPRRLEILVSKHFRNDRYGRKSFGLEAFDCLPWGREILI